MTWYYSVLCIIGYCAIGAIASYVAGLYIEDDEDNEDDCFGIGVGVAWPIALILIILMGLCWLLFALPNRCAKKQRQSMREDKQDNYSSDDWIKERF